ncbi:MAG: HTTM domain-containing protein [Flavobacteriaceae bacterium]|nr:HTTM domain-containing protein [Flavobacteriaceae bacterium]
MLNKLLFRQIDNSALIVFRICFGLLIFLESIGAIFTGWVGRAVANPKFTFNFIGFDWLQIFQGPSMYAYFVIMGIFGAMVMVGYKYRLSMLAFAVLWSGAYFMQKNSYNNHYYLLMLMSYMMVFLPANAYCSVDAKKDKSLLSYKMPQWVAVIIIFQMLIVYTYASIAKMYPDWLDTSFIALLLKSKSHYPIVGGLFVEQWFHYFIAYSGLLFDLLVVPFLLLKPTRKFAFFASIFFHIFNSVIFHVGIFPYLALAICLFFFEPKTIRNIFLKKKPLYLDSEIIIPKRKALVVVIISVYAIYNVLMPLRHWVIQDNVLWTEEGHRLSWRMMLRSKKGLVTYHIEDKDTKERTVIHLGEHLSRKQKHLAATKPDVIWQFSKYLKAHYAKAGKDVAVYVNCRVSVNGRPYQRLIDSEVDIASEEWPIFKHASWILPSKLD